MASADTCSTASTAASADAASTLSEQDSVTRTVTWHGSLAHRQKKLETELAMCEIHMAHEDMRKLKELDQFRSAVSSYVFKLREDPVANTVVLSEKDRCDKATLICPTLAMLVPRITVAAVEQLFWSFMTGMTLTKENRAIVFMCCALMPVHHERTVLMLHCSDAVDLNDKPFVAQVVRKIAVLML